MQNDNKIYVCETMLDNIPKDAKMIIFGSESHV